jgi:hypothetical protein
LPASTSIRSTVGSWASSSGAFSLSPAATWPERCASRASSSGNASKMPNVDRPKRSANHRGGAVLRVDDVQRAAQEALDLLLAAGLRLQAYEQRSGDHAVPSTTLARADKARAACGARAPRGSYRGCLQRWHGIPKGRELTADEQAYAVNVICRWIEQDLVAPGRARATLRRLRRAGGALPQKR